MIQYDSRKEKKIVDAIMSFPVIKMSVKARNFDSEENIENEKAIEEGGEAVLNIYL